MTIFGKIVLGSLFIIISTGIFYGVSTYVNKDNAVAQVSFATTTQEVVAVATSTETASSTQLASSGKKIPFVDFIKQGGSYKCSVTQTVSTMTTNGTVYIHDGLIRGDFAISVAGQSINSYMITKDGYVYTWTSAMPTKGFKTKVVDPKSGNSQAQAKGTYTWDGSQIGEYSCDPWTADTSLFEIPSSVTFTETK
jgi:hypothetical protein